MSSLHKPHWLLVDADDTILGVEIDGAVHGTHQAYEVIIAEFAALMASHGFSATAARATQEAIDTALCRSLGFGTKDRFAESFRQTYEQVATEAGVPVDPALANAVFALGMRVFSFPYIALPGALATLHRLHQDFNIAVVTKGEQGEQHKKLFESGCFVYADQTFVLPHKSMEEWSEIVSALEIAVPDRAHCWAIGNSVKSDINPPLALGFNAIHIQCGEWSFEKAEYCTPYTGRRLEVVSDIRACLPLLTPTRATPTEVPRV
jgi:putative hydrolase of the HAD superfamily